MGSPPVDPSERFDTPLITVVIPCFNPLDEHLRECLESVRDQTSGQWETIVVDDGSTNGDVAGVVAGFDDERIRAVRHPVNRGLGAARNSGYRSALGEVVALLDSDDRLAPQFLEETYRALQAAPEAGWAFTDWQCFGASPDLWAFPNPLPPPCPEHLVHVGPGALVRPRVWRTVGGYTEDRRMSGAADWDFWITASELGLKGFHIARPLYLHRRWPGTMSMTTSVANDATNRELLYRRHKVTFDSFDEPCPRCPPRNRVPNFRARGYVNSSTAALAHGERLRSLSLAAPSDHDPAVTCGVPPARSCHAAARSAPRSAAEPGDTHRRSPVR